MVQTVPDLFLRYTRVGKSIPRHEESILKPDYPQIRSRSKPVQF